MQDKDFDKFISDSLEDFTPEDFNPADWDKMEDRLVNMPKTAPAPQAPAQGFKFSAGKAGFAASMVLLTAVNVYLYTAKPETQTTNPVIKEQQLAVLQPENNPEIVATNDPQTYLPVENIDKASAENNGNSEKTLEKPSEITKQQAGITQLDNAALNKPENQLTPFVAKSVSATKKATKPAVSKPANSDMPVSALIRQSSIPALSQAGGSGTGTLHAGKAAANAAVVECTGKNQPEIPYIINGEDTVRNFAIVAKACEPIAIRIITTDKEKDKLTLGSNANTVLSGSNFTINDTDQPVAWLQWIPSAAQIRNEPYQVTLKVEDKLCRQSSKTYQLAVQVVAPVKIQVTGNTAITEGEASTLQVLGATDKATYSWLPNDGSLSALNVAAPVARPEVATTYYVQVATSNGCVLTDSIHIEVAKLNVQLTQRDIPNTFTPNGDNKNDFFEIKNLKKDRYRLEVYDRSGRVVYRNENYDNHWNADGLPEDTYYYVLVDKEGSTRYNGWVEVFR